MVHVLLKEASHPDTTTGVSIDERTYHLVIDVWRNEPHAIAFLGGSKRLFVSVLIDICGTSKR